MIQIPQSVMAYPSMAALYPNCEIPTPPGAADIVAVDRMATMVRSRTDVPDDVRAAVFQFNHLVAGWEDREAKKAVAEGLFITSDQLQAAVQPLHAELKKLGTSVIDLQAANESLQKEVDRLNAFRINRHNYQYLGHPLTIIRVDGKEVPDNFPADRPARPLRLLEDIIRLNNDELKAWAAHYSLEWYEEMELSEKKDDLWFFLLGRPPRYIYPEDEEDVRMRLSEEIRLHDEKV